MLLLICLCAICLVISAALDMDAIDFDLLVENLTVYNGTVPKGTIKLFDTSLFLCFSGSGNPLLRNRNFVDFIEPSPSGDLEMWMALGGLMLFSVIFSALIIFGTIFTSESILRR